MTQVKTLWIHNGHLVADSSKKALVQCEACPCHDVEVVFECPEDLHTLGGDHALVVTVKYHREYEEVEKMPQIHIYQILENSEVPNTILYDVTREKIADFSMRLIDGVNDWSYSRTEEGDEAEWRGDVRINNLNEDASLEFRAYMDPWLVEEPEARLDGYCGIDLWDSVSCEIVVDKNLCVDYAFDMSMRIYSKDISEDLIKISSDNEDYGWLFTGLNPRFTFASSEALDLGDNSFINGWEDGKWEGIGLKYTETNNPEDPYDDTGYIAINEWGEEACYIENDIELCDEVEASFTTCPNFLHTLGGVKTIKLVITWREELDAATVRDYLPFVKVWSENTGEIHMSALRDEDGNTIYWDASSPNWTFSTSRAEYEADVRTDVIFDTEGSNNRTDTLSVEVYSTWSEYQEEVPSSIATCSIDVSDEVACEITGPSTWCTGEGFHLSIGLTAPNGEHLDRADSEINEHLFFSQGGTPRFTVATSSNLDIGNDDFRFGWVAGKWSSYQAVYIEDNDSEKIELKEYGEVICYTSINAEKCDGISVSIIAPGQLHTLGGDKTLSIIVTWETEYDSLQDADMPIIGVFVDAGDTLCPGCLIDGDTNSAVDFSLMSGNWVRNSSTKATYSTTIKINDIYQGKELDTYYIVATKSSDSLFSAWLDRKPVGVTSKTICGIEVLDGEVCAGQEFDFKVRVEDGEWNEPLVRISDEALLSSNNPFTFVADDLQLIDCSFDEGWLNGEWEGTGQYDEATISVPYVISLYYEEQERCSVEVNVELCDERSVVFTDCPDTLHTLGKPQNLRFTVEWDTPPGISYVREHLPIFKVWSENADAFISDGIIDSKTDNPIIFDNTSSNWSMYSYGAIYNTTITITDIYQIPEYEEAREDVLVIVAFSEWNDEIGIEDEEYQIGKCQIRVSDLVVGEIILSDEQPCVETRFTLILEITDTEGGLLDKVNSNTNPWLFVSPGGAPRFTFDIPSTLQKKIGSTEYGLDLTTGWNNGKWFSTDCIFKEEDVEEEIAILEYEEDIIRKYVYVDPCDKLSVVINAPEYLHTLGGEKELQILCQWETSFSSWNVSTPPDIRVLAEDGTTICSDCIYDMESESSIFFGHTSPNWEYPTSWLRREATYTATIRINNIHNYQDTDTYYIVAKHYDAEIDWVERREIARAPIKVSDEIECMIDIPQAPCVEDEVTITVNITGSGNSEQLAKIDDNEDPFLYAPQPGYSPRFTFISEGLELLDCSFYSGWNKGSWTGKGKYTEEYDEDPYQIIVKDRGVESCSREVFVEACDDVSVIFNQCPNYLHVLGGSKGLQITVTWENQWDEEYLRRHLPVFKIWSENANSVVSTYLEDVNTEGSLTLSGMSSGWVFTQNTATYSTDVRINNVIMPVNSDSETPRKDMITIKAYSLWSEYGDEPLPLNSCNITASDEISCKITAPSDKCVNKPFDISVDITGDDGSALLRADSDVLPSLFYVPGGTPRFRVVTSDGIDIGSNTLTRNWVAGKWAGSQFKCTRANEDEYVKLVEWGGIDRCQKDIFGDACDDVSVQIHAPSSLHTLAGSGTLSISVKFQNPESYSTMPYFTISESGIVCNDCLKEEPSGSNLNLSSGWTGGTGSSQRTFTRQIFPGLTSKLISSESYIVKISAYKTGDNTLLQSKSIRISDVVKCNLNFPEEVCGSEIFSGSVRLVGDNNEVLTKLNSSAFNSRFQFGVGPSLVLPHNCSLSSGWSSGNWSCSGLTTNDLDLDVIVAILDREESICTAIIESSPIKDDVSVSAPGLLHTYGNAKQLRIVLKDTCGVPDMSEWAVTVAVTVDGASVLINDCLCLADGGSLSFAASQWTGGIWSKSVRIKNVPFNKGDDTCSMEITVSATRLGYPAETKVEDMGSITCSRELSAEIQLSETRLKPLAGFDLNINIAGPSGESLSRFPSTGSGPVIISHGVIETETAYLRQKDEPYPRISFRNGKCSAANLYITAECQYFFKAYTNRDTSEHILDYKTITITDRSLDLDYLFDAVNERKILIKPWMPLSPSIKSSWENQSAPSLISSIFGHSNADQFYRVLDGQGGGTRWTRTDWVSRFYAPVRPSAGAAQSEWDNYDSKMRQLISSLCSTVSSLRDHTARYGVYYGTRTAGESAFGSHDGKIREVKRGTCCKNSSVCPVEKGATCYSKAKNKAKWRSRTSESSFSASVSGSISSSYCAYSASASRSLDKTKYVVTGRLGVKGKSWVFKVYLRGVTRTGNIPGHNALSVGSVRKWWDIHGSSTGKSESSWHASAKPNWLSVSVPGLAGNDGNNTNSNSASYSMTTHNRYLTINYRY